MGYGQANQTDREMMTLALAQARVSLESGGVPVGAVLAAGGQVVAAGHNERVQRGDPVAHGEIACLRNAGRQASYAGTTLYTTLSPCQMCSGAILLFQIPRVVVGEAETFEGDLGFLADRGVEIVLLDDEGCVAAMQGVPAALPRSLERGHRRPLSWVPRAPVCVNRRADRMMLTCRFRRESSTSGPPASTMRCRC